MMGIERGIESASLHFRVEMHTHGLASDDMLSDGLQKALSKEGAWSVSIKLMTPKVDLG